MARTNKYTSLNFNDIYEKKIINPNNTSSTNSNSRLPSSSTAHPHKSYSLSASSRLGHGGMLVLSRSSPKPQPQPPPPQFPQPDSINLPNNPSSNSKPSDSNSDSDSISLRPQGKTGGSLTFQEKEISKVDVPSLPSPKSNKFVPPHLRPGFVPREVPPSPEKPRQGNYRPGSAHGNYHGSPNRYVEDGRPKSGSGYERRMRVPGPGYGDAPVPPAVESVSVVSNHPRSGGSRPS
ncbi:proline-rich transmembrane protein 2 [Chenopodium quinoa]|uniref:Uncharacterized protein n=1 Tax=Chenopodium quinoa TaxID=63459 RepID=A0A803NBI9_CHEQI|nr:proline-rich transmembrane protein 2 [Chenopodium quinoa]